MGRFSILGFVLVAAGLVTGCRDSGAAALRAGGENEVTFEAGGDGPSLGELLRRAPPATSGPAGFVLPRAEDVSDGPARKFRTVRLQPGQTLSELCAQELGSAARWREVRELNGWTDADVNRLPPNTPVKLPPH